MSWRIGVDIGGTFTDVAVVNEADGAIGVTKVQTTPDNFASGVVQALEQAIAKYGIPPGDVSLLSHGTTVVTNALLEQKGARCALITSRGFRDLLELRRSARGDLYDLFQDAPTMLVPRRRRLEITERIGADGTVVTPLALAEIDPIIERIRAWKVEAVAVTLLFSFLNDSHERQLAERLRAALPDIPVFVSSEVLPEIREFERTSTTAVCAYVGPILRSYLDRLDEAVRGIGLPSPYVMGSSGGVFEIAEAGRMPAMVVESGPAAGVIAAALVGAQTGRSNLISFDMGGTTAKASLILDGEIGTTPEYEVGGEGNASRYLVGTGHPIRVPVIDLAEVSAGGGSIAWIDPAGALRVGPRSAGARPGPVCYGMGGEEPTVTDCNLLLGRLDSRSLLGGGLPVDFARAEAAIREKLADPLGIGVVEAAAGVIAVVNNAMAEALRIVSVERGHDARDFALSAFGGAGPLHAVALAEELEIGEVVVPPIPGAFSALGLVGTDLRRDYGRSCFAPLDELAPAVVEARFTELERQARAMLSRSGIGPDRWAMERSADLRYGRQAYELTVPAGPGPVDDAAITALAQGFHDRHATTYGHANPDERVQLVTLRLRAAARLPALSLARDAGGDGDSLMARRPVRFSQSGAVEAAVHNRARLAAGRAVAGPAIIESLDSTILVPPSWSALPDDRGMITLTRS